MALEYSAEKFSRAVYDLATGPAAIQDRLLSVFRVHLVQIRPEKDFADRELRERYNDLLARATARSAIADEGPLGATLSAMSDAECSALAADIWTLEADLRTLHRGS